MSHGTVRKAQPAVRVLEDQRKEGKRREDGNDSFHIGPFAGITISSRVSSTTWFIPSWRVRAGASICDSDVSDGTGMLGTPTPCLKGLDVGVSITLALDLPKKLRSNICGVPPGTPEARVILCPS